MQMWTILKDSTREKEEITTTGPDAATQEKAYPLFNTLKRAIKYKPARSVLLLTPQRNPYEAWRLLHQKFAPQNDAAAGLIVEHIMDWNYNVDRVLINMNIFHPYL